MKKILVLLVILILLLLNIDNTIKLKQLNKLLKTSIEKVEELELKRVRECKVTAYSADINQTDSTPFITATMQPVREGGCAISRDLLKDGWAFGSKVYIKGVGVFTINDLMNKRYTNRVDIFIFNKKQAKKFGIRTTLVSLI